MPIKSTRAFPYRRDICANEDIIVAESEPIRGRTMVGVTWNPHAGAPSGYPNARGHQQWFILPEPIAQLIHENEATLRKKIGPPRRP